MPVQPVFETISLNEKKAVIFDKKKVECRTDLNTDAVAKILNVSASSSIYETSSASGKVNYGGRTVFYICYETTDGEIKKCECGTEFLGSLPYEQADDICKVKATSEVIKTEADASGINLLVSATLEIKLDLYYCVNLSMLTGGDDLVCDMAEKTYLKGLGTRETTYPIEEEIEIPYAIQEVLFQRANPIITAVQCGVGVIIVDGEVRLSAVLLQNAEKKDIIREEKVLPFRVEIECEDAMPIHTATASVVERSFKTDVTVDQDKNVSIVACSVILHFEGEVFSTEKLSIADDVFSLSEDLKIEKDEHVFCSPKDERVCEVLVGGVANTDEIPENSVLKAVGGERAVIVSSTSTDNGVLVTGILSATGYFVNGEGKFYTRKFETPFEVTTNCVLDDGDEFALKVKAENSVAKIISATQVEINSRLVIGVCPMAKTKTTFIKNVAKTGDKKENNCALSVFISRQGESLWSLAKRLNVRPETLLETNKDLSFPLSGDERIVIYRQKNR